LRQLVHGLEITERKIESLGTGQKKEPEAAGSWQEVIRFCISSLNRKGESKRSANVVSADDAMLVLLPSNSTSSWEACALSIFALQALVEEPDLRSETIDTVMDVAINNLDRFDGVNTKQNTLMDQVLYSVVRSCFAQQCRERLLQSYIQSHDVRRNKIGAVYSMATADGEILTSENAAQIVEPLLAKLNASYLVEERVDAALKLVEAFYRVQHNATARVDFLPETLLQKTIHLLLKAAHIKRISDAHDDAIASASLWALGWLTNAKTSDSYTA
jgi:hypothetical protein